MLPIFKTRQAADLRSDPVMKVQVDLKTQLTIYTEKIAFRNIGSEPVTSVVLCQSQEHAAREAHLEVGHLPLQ